ncbi:NTP transferase domain-containing protein [Candidatus Gottesmanbacteria bacterium]|nr:NTP transferase domain-containing protein [Candidatus Gottesmanbacteria bacterium]
MKKDLVAVVLAGGEGKRFWPITTDKNLFPFFGKTFFEHAIAHSLPKEVSRVVVVANEDNAPFFQSFTFSVPHDVVTQKSAKGMSDAVLAASAKLQGASLLIVIADVLEDGSVFRRIVKRGLSERVFGVIAGWKPDTYYPGGYLALKGSKILGIHEKPGQGNEPSQYVNVSGHFIAHAGKLVAAIRGTRSDADDLYEKAVTSLMQSEEFVLEPYDGPVTSLKYPWHVLDVMDVLLKDISSHQGKNLEIRNNVVIEGNVTFGDNVKVFENTKIVGPCYIGENTIIGNNNIVRHSHIGAGCVTGFNTDITRSYIGDNCWFHSNYIGDSVIEEDVSMGSGTVCANLRLDRGEIASAIGDNRMNTRRTKLGALIGKNVRIGVNTSFMPGVRIGSNSMVGAGLVVSRDISDASKKLL